MAFALAKENEAFIERMLKQGRFNNQSEVVREALRRMEREEGSYLNPAPLSEQQLTLQRRFERFPFFEFFHAAFTMGFVGLVVASCVVPQQY